MDKVDKLMWVWFITKSGAEVQQGFSFYGGCYEKMPCKTKEVQKAFQDEEFDWDSMRPVESDKQQAFAGTFSDPEMVECLEGVVILKNGKSYRMGIDSVDPADGMRGMMNIVLEMTDIDI